jgi:hypothetical protein
MLRAGITEIGRPGRPSRPESNKHAGFLIVQGSTDVVQVVHCAMPRAHVGLEEARAVTNRFFLARIARCPTVELRRRARGKGGS